MPAIERFASLRDEIARRDTLKRDAKEAEKYVERANEVQALRERLTAAAARIRVLRDYQIEIDRFKDVTSTLTSLQNYLTKLIDTPEDTGRDHGTAKRSFDSLTSDVEEKVEASLRAIIKAIPAVEEVFLRQVELNPQYAARVATIRAAYQALNRSVASAGLSAGDLREFLRKRDELRALADGLNPDDFPQEVLDFFKAAKQGGAPLEKFTEAVRQWLEARGQLKSVRLTVVGS